MDAAATIIKLFSPLPHSSQPLYFLFYNIDYTLMVFSLCTTAGLFLSI